LCNRAGPEFQGKPLKSVTQGGEELDEIPLTDKNDKEEPLAEGELATLIAAVKTALGDAVCDVRKTNRLTDSPVCMAVREGDADLQMNRMMGRDDAPCVLEMNPGHPLIRRLAGQAGEASRREAVEDAAHLLLAQAQVAAGRPPKDPANFARRMTKLLLATAGG
ncbi:MAG: molecular chaperone HtpG, partial [Pseudomonadota bacterium]